MSGRVGSITTDIISDGLIFNLDAANRASTIPSTSTDKTFNTLNLSESGSFSANAEYDSSTVTPSYAFDGIGDKILINSLFNDTFTTTTWSVNFWFNATNVSDSYNYIFANGWPVQFTLKTNTLVTALSSTGNTYTYFVNNYSAGITIAADTWYNATFVRSASNHHQWYINGTTSTSADTNNGTIAAGTSYSTSFIGDWAGGSFVFNGNIGPIHIYNRALSASEVLHNYNALKGRFGL
jgi:hypothetical protein